MESHLHTLLLRVVQASVASLKGLNRLKKLSSCAIRRENKTFRMWQPGAESVFAGSVFARAMTCRLRKHNHQNLCSKANGNKHQHRHTQVGGLTSYPHLTGKGGVRLFGRELSSPTGPLGTCSTVLFFSSLVLCFVLFCSAAFTLRVFRGTTSRVEAFPMSISSLGL